MRWTSPPRSRLAGVLAALAGVTTLGWLWASSLVPGSYSVMDMGAGNHHQAHGAATGVSVVDLAGPMGPPDVAVILTARREQVTLASGQVLDGYTLNGTTPGPEIEAMQGDLVEVTLVNESVPDGVSLHWHGVDVPNAEDGVAGVTQDAVRVGGRHVYRFVAEDAGTYWYHSHQVSHEQVRDGLFGPLVVRAPGPPAEDRDVLAVVHIYDGRPTLSGGTGPRSEPAEAGETVRVRVVNTDGGPVPVAVAGAPFEVAAVDGTDVVRPTPVQGRVVQVAAGGRVDLRFTVPAGSAVLVRLGVLDLAVGPAHAPVPDPPPDGQPVLDLLAYGSPAPLPFDPATAEKSFTYDIGRRPGFVDGRPGLFWTINGRLFPDVPMFMVDEGDVVRMTIRNHSGQLHPMHLHGHHLVVLARDGVPASGSPWWVDSLDVADGETYEVAFVADNPGVWTDHCHNLSHAAQGLIAHVMYRGVTTPFRIGGAAANHPE